MTILKLTLLFAVIFVARGENAKGSEFYKRFLTKQAPPPPAGGAKGKESFVFQSPHGFAHGHGNGFGGYPGYGFGGFGPWGHGHGFGNLGHIHPVPVTGVKALSVAYDPVSGVPYVCDPNKKAGAAGGAGGAGAAKPPATGKRSEIESDEKKNEDEKDDEKKDEKDEDKKDEDEKIENEEEKNIENDDEKKIEKGEEKKDEIKVKIPDYPPCPDPKKSFPWSCILGDKSSKREECARAKKAVDDASKRYWPAAGGFYPPYFGGYRGLGYGGLGVYGGLGPYGGLGLYGGLAPYGVPVFGR